LRTIIRGGHIVDKSLMTASFMEISRTLNVTSLSRKTICTEETDVWCVSTWILPIQTEVIDELADQAGVGEQVRASRNRP
jgi:phosphoserine phosphatase